MLVSKTVPIQRKNVSYSSSTLFW